MKKNYIIFAITFLSLLMGQRSSAQVASGDYTIQEAINNWIYMNPDKVTEIDNLADAISFFNNDGNPNNNFVDVNGDGFINIEDNLVNQNLSNSLGIPINTISDEDLQNLWQTTILLNEIPIQNNYHNPVISVWDSNEGPFNLIFYDFDTNSSAPGGNAGPGNSSTPPTPFQMAVSIASNALGTGLAFNEYYTKIGDAIFSDIPVVVNSNTLIKSVFDASALTSTLKNELELASKLDGLAIISITGKVLGITGAAMSIKNLYDDYQDDGNVSMENVVDVGISVGSLFIKSNVVGIAVSGGWMLIKGDFGE